MLVNYSTGSTANTDFTISIRDVDLGGGDPKFSKMVALQGPQNRKMVALQRPKFGQNAFFSLFSASRLILSFRSLLYIIFDYE